MGPNGGDREWGLQTEMRCVLYQLLLLGGCSSVTSSVNLNVPESGEESIIYISGKTAPLLNDLQQQAVQGKGKTIAPISQMDNWEQN